MSSEIEKHIEIFYSMVDEYIDTGMPYRDALELSAVTVGGLIPGKVSQAMTKYQEAIHPQSHLSQEVNKDALALMSMGVLWDNMYFIPIEPDAEHALENTLAESVYFIMKYAREDHGLELALEANKKNIGDVSEREKAIKRVLVKL